MRIAVTSQKEDLEKQYAGGPDRRSAAKPGQDILRNEGLYLEKKKRPCKDRYGVRQDAQHRRTCMIDHGKPRELTKEFVKRYFEKLAISKSIYATRRTHY